MAADGVAATDIDARLVQHAHDLLDVKADPASLAGTGGWALAQFSLPFMVACALSRRGLTVSDLEPAGRADPRLAGVLRLLKVEVKDQLRTKVELPEPGHVEVRLRDGRTLQRTVTRALGHPDRPMSAEQQLEKFRWCTERLDSRQSDELADAILHVEDLADASELIRLSACTTTGPAVTVRK